MVEKIISCRLFEGFKAEELNVLFKNTYYRIRHFKKGEIIAFQEDECNDLLILVSGTSIAQMVNDFGKLIVVEELNAPKLLAPAFLYAEQNRFPVNVLASEECELLMIPRSEFTSLLQKETRILFNFLKIISAQSFFLSEKVMFFGLKGLKGKIASYLLEQCPPSKSSIEMVETQQELADKFGVARPSLARSMTEMVNDGLISVNKKIVTILDKRALKRLAE
jgi:CRP/FNR family transcriptional regulator, dissimilatory nitrate respiration regulator